MRSVDHIIPGLGSRSQVTNRIMNMWKAGELDANLAMQLLGSSMAGGGEPNKPIVTDHGGGESVTDSATAAISKKRSHSELTGNNGDAAVDQNELEECLDQAKKAKLETWTLHNSCHTALESNAI